jgi:hypothetical protein
MTEPVKEQTKAQKIAGGIFRLDGIRPCSMAYC